MMLTKVTPVYLSLQNLTDFLNIRLRLFHLLLFQSLLTRFIILIFQTLERSREFAGKLEVLILQGSCLIRKYMIVI